MATAAATIRDLRPFGPGPVAEVRQAAPGLDVRVGFPIALGNPRGGGVAEMLQPSPRGGGALVHRDGLVVEGAPAADGRPGRAAAQPLLLTDADPRTSMGRAAHLRVRDHYLADRHLIQYVELFAQLIDAGAAAAGAPARAPQPVAAR